MTESYTIFSEAGDEYRLQFTTDRSNIIADRIFKRYMSQHHIVDIYDNEIKIDGVAETFYFHVIYHKKHEQYAKMIADGHHEDFDKPE